MDKEWNKGIPLYWKYDSTGILQIAVKKLFNEEDLTPEELERVKKYIIKYSNHFLVTLGHITQEKWEKMKKEMQELKTAKEILDYTGGELLNLTIDPF